MSAIDRAFIRAYEADDEDALVAAAPNSRQVLPPVVAPPQAPSAGPRAPHFRVVADSAPAAVSPAVQSVYPGPTAGRANSGTLAVESTGANRGERRPLSTFTPPTPMVEARFRPELEVDAFRWSAVSDALVATCGDQFHSVIQTLLAADERGCSLIGVAGAADGVGTTTITGCLARLLVAAGKTVAIVDGDFATHGLCASLGMVAELGWEDVLAGRVTLADAVIHSIGDRMAVLPLVQGGLPAAERLDGIHASITAGVLRYHYDLVLFDLGSIAEGLHAATAGRLARRCRLDGVLLATAPNLAAIGAARLTHAAPALAAVCLGVIENPGVPRDRDS